MRRYAEHRRAYTPRLWPLALLVGGSAAGLGLWLAPGLFGEIAIAIGLGTVVPWARWRVWRWRHPVIPFDVYVTELIRERRRAARWN